MDFQAIGLKVFKLHLKYGASLTSHFDMVVIHTDQKVNGTVTVTNVEAEGVPPVLRSIRATSKDLEDEVEFFLSGSLEGIDPQLVYNEIIKMEEYRDRVCIIGKTVYIA